MSLCNLGPCLLEDRMKRARMSVPSKPKTYTRSSSEAGPGTGVVLDGNIVSQVRCADGRPALRRGYVRGV